MSAIDRIRQATRRELSNKSPSTTHYSDPYGKHKIRLEQELERDLGHLSFHTADSNGSPRRAMKDDYTHDYSMDYKGDREDTETGNTDDFFPRSPAPSTNELDRHFRDFSMNGIDTSLDSVEMPRGAGKEMGTPELDLKDFDRRAYSNNRPIVDDNDLSSQLRSPSSHARSASLSDFGDMKKRLSPIDRQKSGLRNLPDLDKELQTTSTPREKQKIPERPRSAFLDRYAKPSPPFRRPQNPVGKTFDREYASKPAASTLPRAFKDTTQLFQDLGMPTTNLQKDGREFTPTRNQSFRIPDMTGIQSLMETPGPAYGKKSSTRHIPITSIPIPQEEKDIVSGLRQLQETVRQLTSEKHRQQMTIRELEDELREQKRLYEQHPLRRSSRDSGFGSVEDSDEALERMKSMHARDRMKLENQLTALKSKITLLESQLENERQRTRNVEEERDEVVRRLATALNECDGLKSENKNLKTQIAVLRNQSEASLKTAQVPKATVKDRIKERVETERKKDAMTKKNIERRDADRSFIDAGEIAELRKEIKALREAKEKSAKSEKPVAKTVPKTVDQTTTDTEGNVQTIRIQLENAKERKNKSGKPTKHRRIHKVVVESEDSSNEENETVEDSVTSDSDDEDCEEFIRKAKKNIPIQPWLRPPGQAKAPTVNPEIEKIISGLARHNSSSCSVCARKRRFKAVHGGVARQPLRDIPLNQDLTEPLYEEGESIRPSVPPKQALSSVLSQLKDEFHHLQLQYRDLTEKYETLDPGHEKRKRKAIAAKLRGVLEEFEAKADQIYALYDVVEGARQGLESQSQRDWLEL